MKKYKAVIFDLDGTLMDTITDLANAGNYALSAFGMPAHTVDEYKYFVGNGIPKLIERMLPQPASAADIEKISPVFGEYYSEHKEDNTKPYDGISELLEGLSAKKIPVGIATNKLHPLAQELVANRFGGLVQFVSGDREGLSPKPAPDLVLDVLEKIGSAKDETLFVGDSSVDMRTGLNSGLDVCGVTWGFRKRDELEAFKPAHIVDKPSEILKLF